MSIFSKIKALFSSIDDQYPMGALESPKDNRNININQVQTPIVLEDEYETDMGDIFNQNPKPKCVGSAITKGASYLKGVLLSDDDLYEQCKKEDGIPDEDGTYPSVGAKIATNKGIATVEAYNTGDEDIKAKSRAENKMSGYVFVDADYDTICQTIKQKKFVTASFAVSKDWFSGIITKVLKIIGRHYVILKGFKISEKKLKGQNSWGIAWIGYIAGKFDKRIKAGCFEMLWDDYSDKIYDIIAFTYIPQEIKDKVITYTYRFMTTLKLGSTGYEVKQLQKFLGLTADGSFGKLTQKAVMAWQTQNGLTPDGIFGHDCRVIMNKTAKSLISSWAMAIQKHEGYYAGSRSYRNNNPANFKSGTLTTFMKNLGATGVDSSGFCIFPSYEIGFEALCDFLTMACKGELKSYKGSMTLYDFYKIYAPSSDGNNTLSYAKTVASYLGCTITTKIDELL